MNENESDKVEVPLMSTGVPSTLKNWHTITATFFGEDSAATKFIKDKMDEQGEDEAVLSDERQLIYALWQIDTDGRKEAEAKGE